MARLLIIAHAPLASAFKAVAQHTFPELAARSVYALDVEPGMSLDEVESQARGLLNGHGPAPTPLMPLPEPLPPRRGVAQQQQSAAIVPAPLPPVALAPTQRALSQLTGQYVRDGAAVVAANDLIDDSTETLVLTDVFGATPANAAQRLADGVSTRMLCGINVPMLWRALNYSALPLAELVERSLNGASQGVVSINSTRPQNQTYQPHASDAEQHHHHQQ
ncbi:MAG: hypothetical protein RL722_1482 [Pseudomonadota bacterium]|jgi:mannose/fructose-specific phosphotransferase system component IIA